MDELKAETTTELISKLRDYMNKKDERISFLEEENNILATLLDEKSYELHHYNKENEKLILAVKEKEKKAKNMINNIECKNKEITDKLHHCKKENEKLILADKEKENKAKNMINNIECKNKEIMDKLNHYKKENEKLILAVNEKENKSKDLMFIIECKNKEIMDMLPYMNLYSRDQTPTTSHDINLSNENKRLSGALVKTTANLKKLEVSFRSDIASYREQLSLCKLKLGICEKKYESEVKKNKAAESKLERISSDFADFIIETADRKKKPLKRKRDISDKPLKRKRDISDKPAKKRKLYNKLCYSYLYETCYHNNCRLIHDKKMKSLYAKLEYLITKYTKKGVCFFHVFGICSVKSSSHLMFSHENYIKGIKIYNLTLDKLSIANKIEEFKAIA